MKLYITSIEYDINQTTKDPVLYIFGRTEEGKQRIIKIGPRFFYKGGLLHERGEGNPTSLCPCHRDESGFSPYFYMTKVQWASVNNTTFYSNMAVSHEYVRDCNVFPVTGVLDGHMTTVEPVVKVFTHIPSQVRDMRREVELRKYTAYEANVLYPIRFLVDKRIYSGIEVDDEHKQIRPADVAPNMITWILDIEALSPEVNVPDPMKGQWPVNCIGIKKYGYDFSKEDCVGYQLIYDPKQRQFPEMLNGYKIVSFLSETDMFNALFALMDKIQPSNIIGHNIHWDMSYLIHRAKKLLLDPHRFSPIGIYSIRGDRGIVKIHGRNILDGQELLTNFYKKELPGYGYQSLGDIAPKFGGIKKDLPDGVYKTWDYDPLKVVDYNQGDLEAVQKYLDKDKIVDFFIMLKDLVGARLEDTIFESRLIDVALLRYCIGKIILPTAWKVEEKSYRGALVLEAKPGIYRNVGLADIKSSYPTAIRAFNISPETYDKEGDLVVRFPDLRFRSEPVGLIPRLVKSLQDKRAEFDAEKTNWIAKDYKIAEQYEKKSFAMKTLVNAVYGVLAYKNFRLKDSKVGEAIAHIARVAFTALKDFMESKAPIVYGDTDSVFFQLYSAIMEENIAHAQLLTKEANESMKKIGQDTAHPDIKSLAVERQVVYKAELKRVYSFFILVTKKRYAGKYQWEQGKYITTPDGTPDPQWDFKSLRERSDLAGVSYYLEDNIPKWIDAGESNDQISARIKAIGEEILAGKSQPYQTAIPSRITKAFREYSASCSKKACGTLEIQKDGTEKLAKTKMTPIVPKKHSEEPMLYFLCPSCSARKSFPAHVAGAYYSERYLNVPFKPGTKGRRLYISGVDENLSLPDTKVILVYRDTYIPPGFRFDWERMWETTVLEKSSDFLAILNIPKEKIYPDVLLAPAPTPEPTEREEKPVTRRRKKAPEPVQEEEAEPAKPLKRKDPQESLMAYA